MKYIDYKYKLITMIELYKKLLDEVQARKNDYREKDLVVFPSMKGNKYNQNLMVFGRAVNDWDHEFNKEDSNVWESLKVDLSKQLGSGDFNWADKKPFKENEYNPKKSSFWRVARKLAQILNNAEEDASEYIVYSNLYKVAKAGGGNPSERLARAQLLSCKVLLEAELKFYKPKYVVFLTGKFWAKELFDEIPEITIIEESNNLVYLIGTYLDSKLIVVDHPQGKKEKEIIDAILHSIKF
jgi:hypothetical protein